MPYNKTKCNAMKRYKMKQHENISIKCIEFKKTAIKFNQMLRNEVSLKYLYVKFKRKKRNLKFFFLWDKISSRYFIFSAWKQN